MIIFRKLEDTITGTINGKPFNMAKTPENIAFVEKADKKNYSQEKFFAYVESKRFDEISSLNEHLYVNPVTQEYYLKFKNKRSKHPIPTLLAKRILESFEKGNDFSPIIKAWARFMKNPRYNAEMGQLFDYYLSSTYVDEKEKQRLIEEEKFSDAKAEECATYPDISISKEGMLVTYKVAKIVDWKHLNEKQEDGSYKVVMKDRYDKVPAVIDDVTGDVIKKETYVKPEYLENYLFTPSIYTNGDKFFSDKVLGYVYEVGKIQYLPKSAKRNLEHTNGGGGLYSGGLNYIECYGRSNTETLVCFVDPADILSFQDEGSAFRTDALFPHNIWDATIPLKGAYHSSDYSKLSAKRLKKLIKEAVSDGVDLTKTKGGTYTVEAKNGDDVAWGKDSE